MELRRRGFLAGLGLLVAAPAIIRTPGLLMPIKPQLILPGNFELEGYRLDPSMAYEWAVTHIRGEPVLGGPFRSPWQPVPASLVGAETQFGGQRLVMIPKDHYKKQVNDSNRHAKAKEAENKRRILFDLPDLSGSIPGFEWNFG